MKKLTQNNKNLDCPVCEGTGKAKVIKNIAQIGKYHCQFPCRGPPLKYQELFH